MNTLSWWEKQSFCFDTPYSTVKTVFDRVLRRFLRFSKNRDQRAVIFVYKFRNSFVNGLCYFFNLDHVQMLRGIIISN